MRDNLSSSFNLSTNLVHLWKFSLLDLQHIQEELSKLLSNEELARSERFRFEKDRATFVGARANLRKLLGLYLGRKPEDIVFDHNEQGKPSVNSSSRIQFNISHSKNMIFMGFTLKHQIGVDVEFNQKQIEVPEIAKSFFSKNETEELLSLPKDEQLHAFFRCWTRKEAYIKAKGGGLSIPLDQFEVSLRKNEPACLKKITWEDDNPSAWKMKSLNLSDDYTAACIINNQKAEFILMN